MFGGRKRFCGENTALTKLGADTVTVAEATKTPNVAEIVVAPWLTLVELPVDPMVATEGAEELQTTWLLMLITLPSANVALAENKDDIPIGNERF